MYTGRGTRKAPGARFQCFKHDTATRNWRGLEDKIEYNEERSITSKRQRDNTLVSQTDCKWAARITYKDIGQRGSGVKGFVLTVVCLDYYGHELLANPLSIPSHLRDLAEYQVAITTVRKHRQAVIPYSESRRVLESEEFGITLTARQYYDSVRKMIPDKNKPETIDGLLIALQEAGFIYRTKVDIEEDEEDNVISRKLRQI